MNGLLDPYGALMRTMLSPIPDEERSTYVYVNDRYNNTPSIPRDHTAQGYADFKASCITQPVARCERTFETNLRDLDGEGIVTQRCPGHLCYGSYYCTEPSCPKSFEVHDMMYAVQRGDIVESVRLFRMVFGDHRTIAEFAEIVLGMLYAKDGQPARSWQTWT